MWKKGGCTLVLANHRKGIFPLKRAFSGESQPAIKRFSNEISSFRLETQYFFYLRAANIYVTL